MDIKVLLENDKERKEYEDAHGLSLYIEALGRKILFDFGPGEEFMRNARKMDIKIDEIDFAVLSHGHIDHGGGLPYFLDENKKAPVYIHPKALEPHYSRREDGIMNDIGLPESIKNSKRIVFKQGINWIDDNMALISYVHEEMMMPPGNETLYKEEYEEFVLDDFSHEQNLLINEEDALVLFSGCGHRGILNIMESVKSLVGRYPDHVVGGFHLKKPSKINPDKTYVPRLAKELKSRGAKYYTCHCTGRKMYAVLEETLNDDVRYIVTGSDVHI